jgi:hypothetical protein
MSDDVEIKEGPLHNAFISSMSTLFCNPTNFLLKQVWQIKDAIEMTATFTVLMTIISRAPKGHYNLLSILTTK